MFLSFNDMSLVEILLLHIEIMDYIYVQMLIE